MNRDLFMETLREVKEIVRTSERPLTKDEIMSYFKEIELTNEQEAMVIEYLHTEDEPLVEATEEEVTEETDTPAAESKIFGMYMDEVNELKVYSEEELSLMYVQLLQGKESVIPKICDSYMKIIVDEARAFTDGYGIEDVIQEGNMGLFMELTRLCGSKAAIDVKEALINAVRKAMQDYISEMSGEASSEQTVLGKANLVNEAIKYLTQENGVEPDVDRLLEYTGMDKDELIDVLEIIKKAK